MNISWGRETAVAAALRRFWYLLVCVNEEINDSGRFITIGLKEEIRFLRGLLLQILEGST